MAERASGRSDIVDIACEIRAQTERAIQIFDGKTTCWLPAIRAALTKAAGGQE